MLETEVKYFLGDEVTARAVVEHAGERWKTGELELNRLFDTPTGHFRERGAVVRLRTRGGCAWLTYKRKTDQTAGVAKVRSEHETTIFDPESAAEMLGGLGLVEAMRYEKYRASYRVAGATLELDWLPGGWFCEIEGEAEAIERARQSCGLGTRTPVELTYPEILRKLSIHNILPDLHWTFAVAKRSSISLPPAEDAWWSRSEITT